MNPLVEKLIHLTRQTFNQNQDKNDYCLITLDIRNTWTVPFDIHFKVDNEDDHPVETTICTQPGWTRRYIYNYNIPYFIKNVINLFFYHFY